MHLLLHCLLTLLLTSHAQTPSLAQTQPLGFTTHLIHRDSPSSPFHNPSATKRDLLRAAFLRSISRRNHILRRATPASKAGIDTTLSEADGDYLIQLSFGTPPVHQVLLNADTGSDLIWLQCTPCGHCFTQDAPLFNPANSSGYKIYLCNSDTCKTLPIYACVRNIIPKDACGYYYSYGDNSLSIGILSQDTIALNSISGRVHAFPGSVFGCGRVNDGLFTSHESGMVGLGRGPLSLISQLGAKIDYRFSYCLIPLSSNRTSKLSLGKEALAGKRGAVSTPLASPQPPSTYYYVTLESVTVGRKTFRAAVSGSEGNIIVDSGTTFTFLEPKVHSGVEAVVKSMFSHLRPTTDPNNPDALCYEASPKRVKLPDMVLKFKGGAQIRLKAANVFITGDDGFCLVIFSSTSTGLSIIGNVAQANFEVEFDIKKKLVSFAPKDCTKV
ncbi:aspartic proteinase CDR1-like [Malania oleifera]|uniref:aspartic proteinase CDR1-like n=1 Tax=Malania oleifera TaxID=397392 RepID=UPI0025ADD226|nr:aspartic proteinase CDR1-like [Malania oleifera]